MNGNKESLEELITNLNTAQLGEQTGEHTHALTHTPVSLGWGCVGGVRLEHTDIIDEKSQILLMR